MDRSDRPEAYGVFKPVGHVIASFASDADARAASDALLHDGFAAGDLVFYTPQQMQRQAQADIDHAGALAAIGQELNLVKANLELAEQGHSFLVIKANGDAATERVAAIALRFHASRAQKYGHLTIEELIPVGSGEAQVAESPDRGLDAQTRSGVEQGTPR